MSVHMQLQVLMCTVLCFCAPSHARMMYTRARALTYVAVHVYTLHGYAHTEAGVTSYPSSVSVPVIASVC